MFRILVVDDDAQQLALHKHLLEIAGYQVEIVLTASQTVHRLEHTPADLVIMDLRLPNAHGEPDSREGRALIRGIRDIGYRAPVIVLCGSPEDLYPHPQDPFVSRILLKPITTPHFLT